MKLILAITLLLVSCSSSIAQQTLSESITHDGINREYIIYIPANYTGSTEVPLLFNFHGYTSNANEQMWYGDFRGIADTAGFIIVHPEGTLDGNGITHFNVGWGGSSVDDVGFTNALIDSIAAEYTINLDRVYSTGMSNGGFMSFLLACELSDRIAGIGSVTGSTVPTTLANCNSTHPIPIMQIHGTTDGTVPYNGAAGWSEPINSLVSTWAGINNCTLTPVIENMPNINTTDGSTVEKHSYLDGDNCSEVIHYKITNGDHTWPGTVFNTSGTNYDIDASIEIWNFLSQYDINGKIDCGPIGVEETILESSYLVYPNPAQDMIQFTGEISQSAGFIITDITGSVKMTTSESQIDISELSSGIYILQISDDAKSVQIRFVKE